MKGSVRKRGNTWSYYFDLGKIDGKRKRKEKTGFRTKKEAEAALAKALEEFNGKGSVFEPSSATFADYLDEWMEMYVRPSSLHNMLKLLVILLKPLFSGILNTENVFNCTKNRSCRVLDGGKLVAKEKSRGSRFFAIF